VIKVVILIAAVMAFKSCHRGGWERMLMGPYDGLPFTGKLEGELFARLAAPSAGNFEAYEVPALPAPVLALRDPSGALVWSRVLAPARQLPDGNKEYAGLRELRLHELEPRGAGYAIYILCDWDWGGRGEGGLVHLNENYQFVNFELS